MDIVLPQYLMLASPTQQLAGFPKSILAADSLEGKAVGRPGHVLHLPSSAPVNHQSLPIAHIGQIPWQADIRPIHNKGRNRSSDKTNWEGMTAPNLGTESEEGTQLG